MGEAASQARFKAFISYSGRDRRFVDWFHRSLETYRIPKKIRQELELSGRPAKLYPVFRDRADFSAAHDLNAAIVDALDRSDFLVVVCSPDAARSRWVNEEIRHFRRTGRDDRILAIIASGDPSGGEPGGGPASEQCFPPALRRRFDAEGLPTDEPVGEVLAADARLEGDGRDNARLKIIAALLGVGLGVLKDRELAAARRRTRVAAGIAAAMAVLALFSVSAAVIASLSGEVSRERLAETQISQTRAAMEKAVTLQPRAGASLLLEALPSDIAHPDRPLVPEALDELSTITDEIPDETVVTAPDHAGYTLFAAATQTDRAAAVTGASRLMAWDFSKGPPAVVLDRQLSQRPRDMAMSGDGRHIAVAFPETVLILDVVRGDEKSLALDDGPGSFVSAALSPDGSTLALGDYDGQVVVLDVRSGDVLMHAAAGSSTIQQLRFATSNDRLLARSEGQIVLFDVRQGRERWRAQAKGQIGAVTTDRVFVVPDVRGPGPVLDLATGSPLPTPPFPWLATGAVAGFSVDGTDALIDRGTDSFEIRRTASGRLDGLLDASRNPNWFNSPVQRFLAFGASGTTVVAGAPAGSDLRFVAVRRPPRDLADDLGGSPVATAAVAPDGSRLAVATRDGRLHLFGGVGRTRIAESKVPDGTLLSLLAGAGGRFAAVTSKVIALADGDNLSPGPKLAIADDAIIAAAADESFDRIAVFLASGRLLLWRPADDTRDILVTLERSGPFDPFVARIENWIRPLTMLKMTRNGHVGVLRYRGHLWFFDPLAGRIVSESELWPLNQSDPSVESDLSDDGTLFSAVLNKTELRVIEPVSAKVVYHEELVGGFFQDAAFAGGSDLMVSRAIGVGQPPLASVMDLRGGSVTPLKTWMSPIGGPAAVVDISSLSSGAVFGMLATDQVSPLQGSGPRVMTVWNRSTGFPSRRIRVGQIAASVITEPVRLYRAAEAPVFLAVTPEGQAIVVEVEPIPRQDVIDRACAIPGIGLDPGLLNWLGNPLRGTSSAEWWLGRIGTVVSLWRDARPRASCVRAATTSTTRSDVHSAMSGTAPP